MSVLKRDDMCAYSKGKKTFLFSLFSLHGSMGNCGFCEKCATELSRLNHECPFCRGRIDRIVKFSSK